MRITTRHPASKHGVPVILDDRNRPIALALGIRVAMEALGWDKATTADRTGTSVRTVEGWLQGRPPGAAAELIGWGRYRRRARHRLSGLRKRVG